MLEAPSAVMVEEDLRRRLRQVVVPLHHVRSAHADLSLLHTNRSGNPFETGQDKRVNKNEKDVNKQTCEFFRA